MKGAEENNNNVEIEKRDIANFYASFPTLNIKMDKVHCILWLIQILATVHVTGKFSHSYQRLILS